MDFTFDPVRFPPAEMKQFVDSLHQNYQHYVLITGEKILIEFVLMLRSSFSFSLGNDYCRFLKKMERMITTSTNVPFSILVLMSFL